MEVFGDGPGDGETVEGGGAAADLVEDDERSLSVAWLRMRAVSLISTMKVDWPRERSSDAPTRQKMRSTRPSVARFRRDISADPRDHGDEGDLADVGGFAGHVRAC